MQAIAATILTGRLVGRGGGSQPQHAESRERPNYSKPPRLNRTDSLIHELTHALLPSTSRPRNFAFSFPLCTLPLKLTQV